MKKWVKFLMVFVTGWSSISTATVNDLGSIGDIKTPQQASEYMFRSSPKESLISVQLLGAVQKPGIYYVPSNTDLLKVLTLAGGSTTGGDISEVMVRKTEPEKWANIHSRALDEHRGTYEVDIQRLIRQGGSEALQMNHDDLVYVPARESMFSSETSKTVTMVSVVMSIALTGLLISKNSQERH